MKKVQLSIYLDPEIFRSLEAFAKHQGKPKSLVAEAAVASFLSPDESERREAAIAKRLDRIVGTLERLERNDGVTLETIGLFIRFWLTATPALPEQSSPRRAPRALNATIALSKLLDGACPVDRACLGKSVSDPMKREVLIRHNTKLAPPDRPATSFFCCVRLRSPSSIS